VGGEEAEIAEGSRDIRVVACEYPEGAYFVSEEGTVHGPAWPRREPRSIVM
jgi:hypothetical protein